MEHFSKRMELSTKDSLRMIISKAKEPKPFRTVENMWAIGLMVPKMVKANIFGLVEGDTKVCFVSSISLYRHVFGELEKWTWRILLARWSSL
jgi:hypothetical protein